MKMRTFGWIPALFLLSLPACGDSGDSPSGAGGAGSTGTTGSNSSSTSGGTGGGAGGEAPVLGTHFDAASADWALPAGSPNGNGFFTFDNGLWATVDLDGDGKIDLVVTDGATEQNRKWKLYKNTGTGFSKTAVSWALPAGSPNGNGFFTFVNGLWSTVDLDGDGKLDLVVADGATEQNRKWKLYTNTGTGFSKTAVSWSLPAGSPNGNGFFTYDNGLWSVVDLDGDGKLDLVVTDGATEQNRKWKLYTSTGAGFSKTATDWALPAGSPNGNGFFTFVNGLWSTMDLTGSGKLDLVVTDGATEKNRRWKRYENTGAGFSDAAADWALPAGSPNGNGYFIPANGLWSTVDLDGDRRPDLVVTDGATEQKRSWKLFRNQP